ncbi:MAG: hypothetical protein LiPW41_405 [Parcubacteria group bacterium LiPW_41]|nr:MAG: hypothetical protein LiPW41_405 [Parcubacteria group bacterium LiPW_41]
MASRYKEYLRMKSEREWVIILLIGFFLSLPLISTLTFFTLLHLEWRSVVFTLLFSSGCSFFPYMISTSWREYKRMKKAFRPSI